MELLYSRRHKKQITIPAGHSYCSLCDRVKPGTAFHRCRARKNGYDAYCKDCRAAYHSNPNVRASVRTKPAPVKPVPRSVLDQLRQQLRKYGLTPEDYVRMYRDQQGRCSICGNPETATRNGVRRRLCVDHCHDTGMVRGLLCVSCNAGLGQFKHNPAILNRAIAYLWEKGRA